MNFTKINRPTSSEIIIEQILQSISQDGLKPGDKLPPERTLAEMFGVCRSSVREAIRAMTLMGYLEVRQGKGAYYKRNDPREEMGTDRLHQALKAVDSLDLVDIRDVLERKAVALAAVRANSSQIAEIERAVLRMENQRTGNEARFYQADLAFHQALAEATNNKVLLEIMNLVWAHMTADRDNFLGTTGGDRQQCLATARAVLDGVRTGQVDRAARAMEAHLRVVSTEVQAVVKKVTRPEPERELDDSLGHLPEND